MVRPCMDMGKLEWAKTERRVQNTLEALKSPEQQWGLKKNPETRESDCHTGQEEQTPEST